MGVLGGVAFIWGGVSGLLVDGWVWMDGAGGEGVFVVRVVVVITYHHRWDHHDRKFASSLLPLLEELPPRLSTRWPLHAYCLIRRY